MRLLPWIILSLMPSLAHAAGAQIDGRAGYLSEWEVSATVQERSLGFGRKELSGPLTLKHVGLCSPNGAAVKSGEIHVRMSGLSSSWIKATLIFDGGQCTFFGTRSDTFDGMMDCPNAQGVPLSLSVK